MKDLSCCKRESNIELLRIISMIMIILHHFIYHNGYKPVPSVSMNAFVLDSFNSLGKLGVALFIIITGYYMIERKKIRYNKLFDMEKMVLFYTILCYFAFYNGFNFKIFSHSFFPLITKEYWFFSCYFIIYLLTPYINAMLNNISKDDFKKLLIIGFVFIFLFDFIIRFFVSNIVLFIYYYLVGAYIKLYFKNNGKSIGYLFLFLFFYFSMVLLAFLVKGSFYTNYILISYVDFIYYFGSIFIFFCALFLFLFFISLKIKCSKFINFISSASFGVYLFHDNFLVRDYLWKVIFRIDRVTNWGNLFVGGLFVVFLVYFIGLLIEIIRRFIFKYVDNMVISRNK